MPDGPTPVNDVEHTFDTWLARAFPNGVHVPWVGAALFLAYRAGYKQAWDNDHPLPGD